MQLGQRYRFPPSKYVHRKHSVENIPWHPCWPLQENVALQCLPATIIRLVPNPTPFSSFLQTKTHHRIWSFSILLLILDRGALLAEAHHSVSRTPQDVQL